MTQGLDISSNNHDGEVFNWQQVKSEGYSFVYVKATQGIHYLNPYLVADVRDAANAGLLVGVYHFYDVNSGTPQEQADFFRRNGIHAPVADQTEGDLSKFLTLMPVLDLEQGDGGPVSPAILRDEFLVELHLPAGIYMDRDYQKNYGYGQIAKFGWLAWPEWTNEPLPSVTAIVQTAQQQVQGLGKLCDIDTCSDITRILDAVPHHKKEEEYMDSVIVNINGQPHLVSHVYTTSGHYLEVSRPVGNIGKGATDSDSIIDLTDAYPTISW